MFGGVIYLITDTLMVDVYSVVGGGDCGNLLGVAIECAVKQVGLLNFVFGFLEGN